MKVTQCLKRNNFTGVSAIRNPLLCLLTGKGTGINVKKKNAEKWHVSRPPHPKTKYVYLSALMVYLLCASHFTHIQTLFMRARRIQCMLVQLWHCLYFHTDHFLSLPLCLSDYPLNHRVQVYVQLQDVGGMSCRGPSTKWGIYCLSFMYLFFCVCLLFKRNLRESSRNGKINGK